MPRERSRGASDRRARRSDERPGAPPENLAADVDENLAIAGWLLDFSATQTSEARQLAYRRAADAILQLPVAASELDARGTLEQVRFIGPASARIVREYLAEGTCPTVTLAVEASPQRRTIEQRRAWRAAFLSHAAAERLLADHTDAVSLADYRGDLQMHSTWSDGRQSLDAIVEHCRMLGYRYAGVTDHSHGLPIAGGLSMADLIRQHDEIDTINERQGGSFRLFKGIEANIAADGSLDLTEAERRRCEFVIAAPHSVLRGSSDQTSRILRAVGQPFVHILGHPRGRRFNSRPGVIANWPDIFAIAAERNVAIEIDGYPDRQDVDFELAAQALSAGCVFALDSDAHTTGELAHARVAVAQARLAGIPADRILNCWPAERLASWFESHS
jgi:histidinol phosphatase-like PHP family hydrolase